MDMVSLTIFFFITIGSFVLFSTVQLKITSIDSTTGISTLTFDREHGLSGIVTYSDFTGGVGYNNGTYHNIKLIQYQINRI